MAFRSVDEFRHALAHMNPTMKLPDGTVIEASKEEIMELMQAQAFAPARRSKGKRRSRGKKRQPKTRTYEELLQLLEQRPEGTPAGPQQYTWIGAAAGGMKGLSPKLFKEYKAGRKDITNTKILKASGLREWNHASEILSALQAAGLAKRHAADSDEAKRARQIIVFYLKAPEAQTNPRYDIPLSFPREDYTYGPEPRLAHWTSYPQYSYDQFYRPNTPRTPDPAAATRGAQAGTGTSIAVCNGSGCPTCGASRGQGCTTARGNPTRPHAARRRRVRRNPSVVPIPPSAAGAKPVEWEMATNAGPFLPEMYPYGVRGKPVTYSGIALDNGISEFDRHAAFRAGGTLDTETGAWPVKVPHWSAAKNRQQALVALQFMTRGFGDRAKYAAYIRRLAALYPLEVSANKPIWTFFRKNRNEIKRVSRGRIPTVKTLRKVKPKRLKAVANPRRGHLRSRLRQMEWVHEDE